MGQKSIKTKLTREEILVSAISLAKLLIENRPLEAQEIHVKELLQILVWKATEADGKHRSRYVSEGFYQNPDKKNCEHEHVIEKKKIVAKMIESPESVGELLNSAIACLVLKEEHKRLTKLAYSHPELEGWDRYRTAGIRVFDTLEKRFLW